MVASTAAGDIGGGSSFYDDDGQPVVVLAVMPGHDDDDGEELWLHVGDTFDLGEETWRVDEIDPNGTPRFGTTLTRIR